MVIEWIVKKSEKCTNSCSQYPDIVTVKDLQAMLGISRHAAYDLLGEGEISCIRLANAYKIPKINVINYVLKSPCGQTRVSA